MSVCHSQCLLFIVDKPSGSGVKKLRKSSESKSFRPASSSAAKGYALFSEALKKKRPEVLKLFERNDLLILSNQNVSSLLRDNNQKLEVLELLLDESPSASLNPLTLKTDNINTEILGLLFRNIIVRGVKRDIDYVRPAVDTKNFKIVERLLAQNTDIYHRNDQGECFLHLAAKRGPESLVKLALKSNADINVRRIDGVTPLHLAAESGIAPVIQLLLERGADCRVLTKDGVTPLHLAVPNGCYQIAQLLLERGVDAKAQAKGVTSLHLAAVNGYPSIVQLLLRNGAVIDSQDSSGNTPLSAAIIEGQLSVLRVLLRNGADVNITSESGKTPIFHAVRKGHFMLILVLLKFGAQVNIKDQRNHSILIEAYLGKHHWVFEYLLECYFVDPKFLRGSGVVESFLNIRHWMDLNDLFFENHFAHFSIFSQSLARHFVKINALNLYHVAYEIDVLPLWIDSTTSFNDFKTECEKEVVNMKRQTLGDTGVSFYDVLGKSASELAHLLRNGSIAKIITPAELKRSFPIYHIILMLHIDKGMKRQRMLGVGIQICQFLFNQFEKLPLEIKEQILGYLSEKDFVVLREACRHYDPSPENINIS